MKAQFLDEKPLSIKSYYQDVIRLKLPTVEVRDPETDDDVIMAYMLFMGLRWQVTYWETTDESGEDAQEAYFDTYEEAEEFMRVQLILARML